MKRDIDLIRKILFDVEEKSNGIGSYKVSIDGYDEGVIGYHNKLLIQSGLAVGIDVSTTSSKYPEYMMTDLTPEGHDFLDAVRSDNIWNTTKSKVNKIGSWTLDIVKAVAVACVKEQLNI